MFFDHTRYIWTYTKYQDPANSEKKVQMSQAFSDFLYMIIMTGFINSHFDIYRLFAVSFSQCDNKLQVRRRDNYSFIFQFKRNKKKL